MRFNFGYQKFYKGERVKYMRKKPQVVIEFGETGTVLADWSDTGSLVLINWDKEDNRKYSLRGCPDHHGWVVRAEDLEKIL